MSDWQLSSIAEWLHLMKVTTLFANVVPDVLFAVRQFVKRPGIALTCIAVLALGIGSCLTGFSVLYEGRHSDVFSEAGIFSYNNLVMTGSGAARHLDVVNASSSLFEVLGVKPK